MSPRYQEIFAKKHRLVLLVLYVVVIGLLSAAYLTRTSTKIVTSEDRSAAWRLWGERPDSSRFGNGGKGSPLKWRPGNEILTVAVGGGITSKGSETLNEENIATIMPLFTVFIPSFCETASSGFDYRFYFAYDDTDALFTNSTFRFAYETTFLSRTRDLCSSRNLNISIHMVRCSHSGKPTWAQNEAMLEAYLDNVDYYYRINDDTRMITKRWTELFIEVLQSYVPANVGVVGPKHFGGNIDILTYDFVHRTHVDIFGFYYPRLFTDWFGDDWITNVYRPYRSTKHQDVLLEHTLGKGTRYIINRGIGLKLKEQVAKDMETLRRYINYSGTKDFVKTDGKKVISISLFGNNPKYLWGAIRNAQVAPIFFPGWKLRFYVASGKSKAADVKSWLVPRRILNKLKQLGAEIAYVKTSHIPPVFWRYLVADDIGVDYFIVRNAHGRLTERDATAVNEWLKHQNPNGTLETGAVHCIRDHPTHANQSVVDGLWGGNRKSMHRILASNMSFFLDRHFLQRETNPAGDTNSSTFLRGTLWPLVSTYSYCHDSISCVEWPGVQRFMYDRRLSEYLGQSFDEHEEPLDSEQQWTNFTLNCNKSRPISSIVPLPFTSTPS